jgi:dihydroxyacetone kinase-like predicted kinase
LRESRAAAFTGHAERRNGSGGPRRSDGERSEFSLPLAVIAVAAGEGLAKIFRDDFGVAAVVEGGQSSNPSTGELMEAIESVDAEEILLLPNNPNVVLAARQVAELSDRQVVVVPTRNAAEGFAALLALDPTRGAAANAEPMTKRGRGLATLAVTEAIRDATIGGRKVKRGQTIVLDPDEGLVAADRNRDRAILAAVATLDAGVEIVTIYYGDGADLEETEAVARRIVEARPGVEVELFHGGQPYYRYLIAAE